MMLPWYVAAQPDEWLLCIRNGRLVKAGVGISLWRRPGDVVVRFTSTVQRVGFSTHALTREHLLVSIDGFILWSVSAQGDGPFRAFQKLGVSNISCPGMFFTSIGLSVVPAIGGYQNPSTPDEPIVVKKQTRGRLRLLG